MGNEYQHASLPPKHTHTQENKSSQPLPLMKLKGSSQLSNLHRCPSLLENYYTQFHQNE